MMLLYSSPITLKKASRHDLVIYEAIQESFAFTSKPSYKGRSVGDITSFFSQKCVYVSFP